ncbi:MAG: IS1 family transposase [Alphaproteobacteria bacterium]|nr:MAG: IS1 family transposase [Alphaproteobacteria bacterium]
MVYVCSKKEQKIRVWLAVDRNRNKIVASHIGGGTAEDARKLYWKIHRHTIEIIATDGNYAYDTMFPHYQKHIVDKAETCLVEAKNSSMRDMLARLNRRTKRYSKSIKMLQYAVWLWIYKDFAIKSIYCWQCLCTSIFRQVLRLNLHVP